MIPDNIFLLLRKMGYKPIEVNANNIYLYYTTKDYTTNIVILYDCPLGMELTEGQYINTQRQVYQYFINKDYTNVCMLNILCTEHIEEIKKIYNNDDNQWIIDTISSRLILYENQDNLFIDFRRDLENILEAEAVNKKILESDITNSNLYEDKKEPYKKERTKYFSQCNTILIVVNIIIFFIVELQRNTKSSIILFDTGALYWPAIKYYDQYYRMITYMFLHSGFEHLANNMLVLFVIGDNLERAVGKWKFLCIYFFSGIIAGIFSISYNMVRLINAVSVGASGAIFGVVGSMVYIVAVNKGRLENISTRQMIVFIIFSLYGGLTSQGVDNAAHIGGLIGGAFIAAILYRKPKIMRSERD